MDLYVAAREVLLCLGIGVTFVQASLIVYLNKH